MKLKHFMVEFCLTWPLHEPVMCVLVCNCVSFVCATFLLTAPKDQPKDHRRARLTCKHSTALGV